MDCASQLMIVTVSKQLLMHHLTLVFLVMLMHLLTMHLLAQRLGRRLTFGKLSRNSSLL